MLETLTLDNETIARLSGRIHQFAAEYGCAGHATYVLFGNALLRSAQVEANAQLLAKVINRHRRLTRVSLPLVADRIETRTNARIFGLTAHNGRDATVKILMRHSGKTLETRKYGNSLFADLHARRLAADGLRQALTVFAPRVFDYDRERGRWIVEEYVAGIRATRKDVVPIAASLDVPAIYRGAARMRPIGRSKAAAVWQARLAKFDPDFPAPHPSVLWPEALVHGDLRGNMRITPDRRLCLIDWELARIAPVAIDMASLYFLNPNLKPFLIDWLRQLDPEGRALAPEIQLALALMRHTKEMIGNPYRYISDLMQKHRIDHAEAKALYERERSGVREYLAYLRAP